MFNKCNKNKTKNILWFYNVQDELIKMMCTFLSL